MTEIKTCKVRCCKHNHQSDYGKMTVYIQMDPSIGLTTFRRHLKQWNFQKHLPYPYLLVLSDKFTQTSHCINQAIVVMTK